MPGSQTDFYARLPGGKELSWMVIGSMVRGKEMTQILHLRARDGFRGRGALCG